MNLRELALEIERLQKELRERTCHSMLAITGHDSVRCIRENDGHEWHESTYTLSSVNGEYVTEIKWRENW